MSSSFNQTRLLLLRWLLISANAQCMVCFNVAGVIYLTADVDRIHFPSGQFFLEVSATDGGHPPLSTVAMLRVIVDDAGAAADNKTALSGGIALLLRSALSSNRLATILSVLLTAVVLTIVIVLLFTVIVDRRRCRLPDQVSNCRCLPMQERHQKTSGSVLDVLRTTCCCCCCTEVSDSDSEQQQRKCKPPALYTDEMTITTARGVSASTSTVFAAAVRRVGASNESL